MARPPLEIGTYGNITATLKSPGEGKDPRWCARARFRDRDGVTRPVERWGDTENKAKNALRKALAERSAAHGVDELTGASKFNVAATLWLETVKDRAPGTYDRYSRAVRNHLLPRMGNLRLRECTVPRLLRVEADLARTLAPGTRRILRGMVSSILRLAVQYDAIEHNPVREMPTIRDDDDKAAPRALTVEDRELLLDHLDVDPYASEQDLPDLVRTLMWTGLRIGELCALRWGDVNLGADAIVVDGLEVPPGYLAVTGTIVYTAERGIERRRGKTVNARRVIPLPDYLQTLLRVRRPQWADDAMPMFPNPSLTWRYPTNTNKQIKLAAKRAGLPWVTSHTFRRTVATLLDQRGMSARAIADFLGHARPSMTQDVYMGRGLVEPAVAAALDAAYERPIV